MRAVLGCLVGLALGCAAPISIQLPDVQQPYAVHKIVLLPFTSEPVPGGSVEGDAAAVVTTRVLQALTQETRLDIVPPGEAVRVSAAGKTPSGVELRQQFGVDAILTGVVHRYVERIGGPSGAMKPASVWFSLDLRTPDGTPLWSGTYEESQRALSEDLGSFSRAWDRGFRWVTAADLAGYGARQLSRSLALDLELWS
jgi:hypothetical protein